MRVGDGGGGSPSMQIEVPRESLLEAAADFEAVADKLDMWLLNNVPPRGGASGN